jgi:hypothetical protein
MLLSTSGSEQTAAHREILHRVVPRQAWPRILVLVLLLEAICVASWEAYWRAHYFVTDDYEDTPAVWQLQRERAVGAATVLIGSSRMWQDVDLSAWQQVTGKRPIQLAAAGKNPRPVLHDLANDPRFHGLVLCGVTPYLFFIESEAPINDLMRRGRTQTLAQRASNRLGMGLEHWLAFIDNETRLSTRWKRVRFALRAGAFPVREVPKGHIMGADRGSRMWTRLEQDPDYLAVYQRTWLFFAGAPVQPVTDTPPAADLPGIAHRTEQEKLAAVGGGYPGLASIVATVAAQVAIDVNKIRARGGDVAFIRFPASGPVYADESSGFPRSIAWEPFLAQTHTVGVHFADYPQLQGYRIPEWSHMAAEDSPRFTRELAPLVLRAVGRLDKP